jgi:membrane protease YdiL (CAAX protease family)
MESSLESPTPPASLPAGEAPLVVRRPSPFDRLRARALIGWFIAWSMIVTVAAIAVARLVEGPGRHVNLDDRLSGILSALVMIGVALALARGARLDWRRLFGRWPTRAMLPLALVMVPVALFTYVTTIAVYLPLSYVAPRFVRWILAERGLFAVSTVPQWVLLMVVGAIAAPVSEEIIFRGLLLHRWARRWGTTTGVVASSVLFAMRLRRRPLGALPAHAQPLAPDPRARGEQRLLPRRRAPARPGPRGATGRHHRRPPLGTALARPAGARDRRDGMVVPAGPLGAGAAARGAAGRGAVRGECRSVSRDIAQFVARRKRTAGD